MPSKSTRRNPLLIPLLVVFLVALIAVVLLIVNGVRHGNKTSQLQQERIALNDLMMTSQLENAMMREQLSEIEMILQTLQDENAPDNPAEHVKAIVGELQYARRELDGLPDALAANSALQEEKTLLEADTAMLISRNAEITEDNAALTAQIDTLAAENAVLTSDIEAMTAEIAGLEADKAMLEGAIAELTAANTVLTEANTALEAAKAALEAEAENAEEANALKAQIEAMTAEIAGLEAEKAELEGTVAELTNANAALTEANTALEAAKAALEVEAANAEASNALAEANAALTAENAVLTEKNAELSAALDALTAELSSITGTLNATQTALHAALEEAAEAQSTMISLLGKTASVQGYGGPVSVTAVVDEQGRIVCLTIDASGETEGIGQQVMEPRYVAQFKGKTLPLLLGENVDAVSGATVTSQAVVDALNLLTPEYATPHDNVPTAE